MQTILLHLGQATLVSAACCAFRLDRIENRERLVRPYSSSLSCSLFHSFIQLADSSLSLTILEQANEVLVLSVKADPSWVKGEKRRIVLDQAKTVPFNEVRSFSSLSFFTGR